MTTIEKTIKFVEAINAMLTNHFEKYAVGGMLTMQFVKSSHDEITSKLGTEELQQMATTLLDNYYKIYQSISENQMINAMAAQAIMLKYLQDLKSSHGLNGTPSTPKSVLDGDQHTV